MVIDPRPYLDTIRSMVLKDCHSQVDFIKISTHYKDVELDVFSINNMRKNNIMDGMLVTAVLGFIILDMPPDTPKTGVYRSIY